METAENNRLRKSRNLEDQLDVTIGQNTSNPVVILIPCLPQPNPPKGSAFCKAK